MTTSTTGFRAVEGDPDTYEPSAADDPRVLGTIVLDSEADPDTLATEIATQIQATRLGRATVVTMRSFLAVAAQAGVDVGTLQGAEAP